MMLLNDRTYIVGCLIEIDIWYYRTSKKLLEKWVDSFKLIPTTLWLLSSKQGKSVTWGLLNFLVDLGLYTFHSLFHSLQLKFLFSKIYHSTLFTVYLVKHAKHYFIIIIIFAQVKVLKVLGFIFLTIGATVEKTASVEG